MTRTTTKMREEILEIPAAADRLLTHGHEAMKGAADALRDRNPAFMVSVARGSSDHVATYVKYVSEFLTGVPVASVGPSVASVYKRRLKLANSACVSVSQSGKSPDIVEMARVARDCGALSFAMTSFPDSPLAQVSDHTLNLHAGPELSVADEIADKGATVFVTSSRSRSARALPVIRTGHPLTDPITLIASFYGMVDSVAEARGINPDAPRHLNKVTETV